MGALGVFFMGILGGSWIFMNDLGVGCMVMDIHGRSRNVTEAHLKKPNRGVVNGGSVATGENSPCLAFSGGPLCSIMVFEQVFAIFGPFWVYFVVALTIFEASTTF